MRRRSGDRVQRSCLSKRLPHTRRQEFSLGNGSHRCGNRRSSWHSRCNRSSRHGRHVHSHDLYVGMLGLRIELAIRGRGDSGSRSRMRNWRDRRDLLPTFIILVPAYKEPRVLPTWSQLSALNYPRIVWRSSSSWREDDIETIEAAAALHLSAPFEGSSFRRSGAPKPKALNYALLGCTESLWHLRRGGLPGTQTVLKVAATFAHSANGWGVCSRTRVLQRE